jgi:hypothetical protein
VTEAPYWVLDSGAVMAFVHGEEKVGQVLVDMADVGGTVALPLVCVIEAYSLLHHDEHEMVRTLRRNPVVQTVEPTIDLDRGDDCPVIGSMARTAGRLGAGHAAYTALVSTAGVVTSRPDQIRSVLGEEWTLIEV